MSEIDNNNKDSTKLGDANAIADGTTSDKQSRDEATDSVGRVTQLIDGMRDKTEPDNPSADEKKKTKKANKKKTVKDNIDDGNRMILMGVLAPELSKNEELKREQKKNLLGKLFLFIAFEMLGVFVLSIIVIIAIITKVELTESLVVEMFGLLKFFITAIIGEFIAMLFFIVKNVFDTSVPDLFKMFKGKEHE